MSIAISSHLGMGAILYPSGVAFRVWAKFGSVAKFVSLSDNH